MQLQVLSCLKHLQPSIGEIEVKRLVEANCLVFQQALFCSVALTESRNLGTE